MAGTAFRVKTARGQKKRGTKGPTERLNATAGLKKGTARKRHTALQPVEAPRTGKTK